MYILMYLIPVEVFLFAWTLITGKRLIKEKGWIRLAQLLLLVLFAATGVVEWGARYYIIAVILGIQALAGVIQCLKPAAHKNTKPSALRSTGYLTGRLLLYLAALIPALMFPEYQLPAPTGSHPVAEALYTWTDTERVEDSSDSGENRRLTVKFWYPEDGQGEYPLILFSHGAFGIIDSNYSTCKELASHGYVVASIGHPNHAMFVQDTDGKMTFADPSFVKSIYAVNDSDDEAYSYEESRKWMKLRTDDENFVLDTILSLHEGKNREEHFTADALLFTMIDPYKIGLFGHSMGGASSAQLGRERTDISAVIVLEGTMFGEYSGVENGIGIYDQDPYPVPLLDVYSQVVYDQAIVYSDKYANFSAAKHAVWYDSVIFKDAGHLNFTDLPIVSPFLAKLLGTGTTDAYTSMENVNQMVLAFFDAWLKEKGEPVPQKIYGD